MNVDNDDRQQRRRRVGAWIWKQMRNPKTLKLVFRVGYLLYRLIRFIFEFFLGTGG